MCDIQLERTHTKVYIKLYSESDFLWHTAVIELKLLFLHTNLLLKQMCKTTTLVKTVTQDSLFVISIQ